MDRPLASHPALRRRQWAGAACATPHGAGASAAPRRGAPISTWTAPVLLWLCIVLSSVLSLAPRSLRRAVAATLHAVAAIPRTIPRTIPYPPRFPVVGVVNIDQGAGGTAIAPADIGVDARAGRVLFIGRFMGNQATNPTERTSLYAADARDGHIVRAIRLSDLAALVAFDPAAGRTVVVTGQSPAPAVATLYDDGALALVGTAPVSDLPAAVRVDEARGRAFVVNTFPQNAPTDPNLTNSVSMIDIRSGRLIRVLHPDGLFNGQGGEALLSAEVDAATGNLVVVAGGNGAPEDAILLVDPTSGAVRRRIPVPGPARQPGDHSFVAAHVYAQLRRIFVVSRDGHTLVVIDADNGRVVRTLTLRHPLVSLVADERAGRVFAFAPVSRNGVGGPPRRVDVFDGHGGDLLSSTVLGEDVATVGSPHGSGRSPIAGVLDGQAGRLFVPTINAASMAGHVDVFDTHSGALIASRAMPAASILIPSASGQRVLALETRLYPGFGAVSVLNGRTGATVTTYPRVLSTSLDGADAVAVDAGLRRAFVFGGDGELLTLNTAL